MLKKLLLVGGLLTAVLVGFVATQARKDPPPPPEGVDIEIEDLQIDIGGLEMDFEVGGDLAQSPVAAGTTPEPSEGLAH